MKYEAFLKRVGEVIRSRRQELKLTQAELADKAGTDQGNISRIERGRQGFDSALLFGIGRALDLPLSVLFALAEGHFAEQLLPPEIGDMAASLARLAYEDRAKYDAIRVIVTNPSKAKN